MTSIPGPALDTYLRLSCRATLETIRIHPTTSSYYNAFATLARQRGILEARAWLLGRLILDFHPHPALDHFNPSPYSSHRDLQAPERNMLPLQQDIETA